MELLGENPEFNIYGEKGNRIYARNYAMPSTYIAGGSVNSNSFIAEGCEIYGKINHSIISTGCIVDKDAVVEDSVIMPNVVIESGAIVRHAIIGEDCRICRGSVIGGVFAPDEEKSISVVGKGKIIEANTAIKPGEIY